MKLDLRTCSWLTRLLTRVAPIVWVTLVSCTASQALDRYPRRYIDRPFTLPEDVASWQFSSETALLEDTNNNESGYSYRWPIPLVWEQALTDKLTLVWAPIPLGLKYQIHRDEAHLLGVVVGGGFGVSSVEYLLVAAHASLYYRFRLTDYFALATTANYDGRYQSKSKTFGHTGAIGLKSIFQLGDVFALGPWIEYANRAAPHKGWRVSFYNDPSLNEPGRRIPFGAFFSWSLTRQWDVNGSYGYHRIGYADHYRAHLGHLRFIHYW